MPTSQNIYFPSLLLDATMAQLPTPPSNTFLSTEIQLAVPQLASDRGMFIRDTIAWACTDVLFPLSPLFFGALIRFWDLRVFDWSIFNPADMSISFAILCFIFASNTRNMRDEALAKTLWGLLLFMACLFVIIFSLTTVSQLQSESGLLNFHNAVRDYTNQGTVDTNYLLKLLEKVDLVAPNTQLGIMRVFSFGSAIVAAIFLVVCRYNYKLGD